MNQLNAPANPSQPVSDALLPDQARALPAGAGVAAIDRQAGRPFWFSKRDALYRPVCTDTGMTKGVRP
jgi:hypothetical protein